MKLTLVEQNQPIEVLPPAPVDQLVEARPPLAVLRDKRLVRAEHDALAVPPREVTVRELAQVVAVVLGVAVES